MTIIILIIFICFVIYTEHKIMNYNKSHKKHLSLIQKTKVEYNSAINNSQCKSDEFLKYIQEVNRDLKNITGGG